ncbi:MAG: hypothetical protein GC155_14425 [Alphaproteobacteria bacterium]|nr:hypothetical protein [Alphaproteobacteria bacterium]
MKLVLVTTALTAAMAMAPAFAQEATPQTSAPAVQGNLTVEGVKPAEALGAIDTDKLVADPQNAPAPGEASSTSISGQGNLAVEGVSPSRALGAIDTKELVDEPPTADQTASADTTIEPSTEAKETMVHIASVNVPLPKEVAQVASNGKYSTSDLVSAQLMAMNNEPVIRPTISSSTPSAAETPTTDKGSPVFDKSTSPGDWSQSAKAGPPATEPTP